MTKNFLSESAKIYQFPVKNCSFTSSDGKETKTNDTLQSPKLAPVHRPGMIFGSAWYHEEAVQDAKTPGKI